MNPQPSWIGRHHLWQGLKFGEAGILCVEKLFYFSPSKHSTKHNTLGAIKILGTSILHFLHHLLRDSSWLTKKLFQLICHWLPYTYLYNYDKVKAHFNVKIRIGLDQLKIVGDSKSNYTLDGCPHTTYKSNLMLFLCFVKKTPRPHVTKDTNSKGDRQNLYHKYFRPPYPAECLFRLTTGSATNGHEPFTSSASQLHFSFLRFHQLFCSIGKKIAKGWNRWRYRKKEKKVRIYFYLCIYNRFGLWTFLFCAWVLCMSVDSFFL